MRKNKLWVVLLLFAISASAPRRSFADDDDSAPPPPKSKLKWLQDLSANADSSSNQSATVAGVRGLEEVGAPPDTTARDVKAIDRLDTFTVKTAELKTFLAEGKLQ